MREIGNFIDARVLDKTKEISGSSADEDEERILNCVRE